MKNYNAQKKYGKKWYHKAWSWALSIPWQAWVVRSVLGLGGLIQLFRGDFLGAGLFATALALCVIVRKKRG